MKDMHVEVITLAISGNPKSRLRVTWKTQPNLFARIVLRARSVEMSAIFAGTRDVWHVLPEWRRAPRAFELQLKQFEARLMRGDEATPSTSHPRAMAAQPALFASSNVADVHPADRLPTLREVVERRPDEAPIQPRVTVYVNRRSRRLKLH
jgi:hypothetical protein